MHLSLFFLEKKNYAYIYTVPLLQKNFPGASLRGWGLPAVSPAVCRVPAVIRLRRRLCPFAPLSHECVKGSRPVFILPCAPSERTPNPAAWHLPADPCRGAGSGFILSFFFCNARAVDKTSSFSRPASLFLMCYYYFCFVAAAYLEKQGIQVVLFRFFTLIF